MADLVHPEKADGRKSSGLSSGIEGRDAWPAERAVRDAMTHAVLTVIGILASVVGVVVSLLVFLRG